MTGLLNYNRGNFQSNANLTWDKKKQRPYGLPTANVPNVAPSSSVSPTPVQAAPDNTMQTLQGLMSVYQSLKDKPTTQPTSTTPELQAYKPVSLEYNKPAWQTEQSPTAGLIPQAAPIQAGQTVTGQSKASGLMDYWKRPVWEGGMPLDQFVTLAGMLAHSIAPESTGGRMGAGLAGMAGPIYKERMAQETALNEPKKPQIAEVAQRLYGISGTAEAPVATALTPEPVAKPQTISPHYVENIQDGKYGIMDITTNKFTPVREATSVDESRIVEKAEQELKGFTPQITPYKNVASGKLEYLDANNPVDIKKLQTGNYAPYEKPEKVGGIGKDDGMAKVGNLAAVTKELASKYLSLAKNNIPTGSTTGTASINNLMLSLQPTDQFSGSINDARLRDTLTQEQRDSYDWVKIRAQELASKHPPAKAVNEALKEWRKFNKTSEGTQKQSEVKTIIRYNAQGQRMQ